MTDTIMRQDYVGLASQPKALDNLAKTVRMLLRLVGPRVSAAQDEQMLFRKCNTCSPPEEIKRCVICGFAAEMRWQYTLHWMINPETCQRTAARKARKWASRV